MTTQDNPHKLNPLQLKTLTILQQLARVPGACISDPSTGEVTINRFPSAHGDHFHLGDVTVRGADMTGLFNQAVWTALERKGLARSQWPAAIVLTVEGTAYKTGMENQILFRGGH